MFGIRSQPVLVDSSGKSGAMFYQSYDRLFILKSLTSEEVERMHSFLKHYHPVSCTFMVIGFLNYCSEFSVLGFCYHDGVLDMGFPSLIG
jgi:hypothetical protein